ncbi:MAG: DUF5011 domain-containing protein [Bacteroidota bacterium]
MKRTFSIFCGILFICLSFWAGCKKNDTPKDITPPVISLNGSSQVYVEKGTSYTDAGATATDNVDGVITDKIVVTNLVDANVEGTYYVKYNVSDEAGNKATEVVRTVIVKIF